MNRLGQLVMVAAGVALVGSCGDDNTGGGDTPSPGDVTPPLTSASPPGGTYDNAQDVTVTCIDNGSGCLATFFTTDGTEPTQSSSVYSAPITISTTRTLKFFSVDNAGNSETTRTETYTITGAGDTTPPVTTASPRGGTFTSAQNVTLLCSDSGGSGCVNTYYTTDGLDPSTSSAVYSGPIAVPDDMVIKFFSVDVAGNAESIQTETYVIDPTMVDTTPPVTTATPAGGSYDSGQSITLTCSDTGSGCVNTYFTTNGANPTQSSSVYATPIPLSQDMTLKFFSVDGAGNVEAFKTEDYILICTGNDDTDGDGLEDCDELEGWTVTVEAMDGSTTSYTVTSDPLAADADGDGLNDLQEKTEFSDPNDDDTDGDGLDDWEEVNIYNCSPYDMDSDNDAVPPGGGSPHADLSDYGEVSRDPITSPMLADTDGDALTDYEETVGIYASQSYSPLIANLPVMELSVTPNYDITVTLNQVLSGGCTLGSDTYQAVLAKDSASSQLSSSTYNKFEMDSSVDLHAHAEGGFDGPFPHGSAKASSDFSLNFGMVRESTTSFSSTSAKSVTRDFRRNERQECFQNTTTTDGNVNLKFDVRNAGDKTFTIRALNFSLEKRDPDNPTRVKTLADVTTPAGFQDLSVEPDVIQSAVVDAVVPGAIAMELLRDPSGLYFKVNSYTITDELGRDYAYINTETRARTAMLEIDFGNGDLRRYMVATNVERDPSNPDMPAGVTVSRAMEIVGHTFVTGTSTEGYSTLITVNDGTTDWSVDPSTLQFWFVYGKSDSIPDPTDGVFSYVDFEEIVLEAGDYISLSLARDTDGDGLFDREERFHGSDPTAVDTDRDTFDDYMEVHHATHNPIVPEFPGGERVLQVATGSVWAAPNWGAPRRTVALLDNGSVWTWGIGRHGDGTSFDSGTPILLESDLEFDWIATGGDYRVTIGITTDGAMYSWGGNGYGMLGIGSADDAVRGMPVRVGSDSDWDRVWIGRQHVLALRDDGALYGWGGDASGELGTTATQACPGATGTNVCRTSPTLIHSGPWYEVSAGYNSSLGIRSDESLWGWGENAVGQLGLGDSTDRTSPVQIDPGPWTHVSTAFNVSMASKREQPGSATLYRLWTWGSNLFGGLGRDGQHLNYVGVPIGSTSCSMYAPADCVTITGFQNAYCLPTSYPAGMCYEAHWYDDEPAPVVTVGDIGKDFVSIQAGTSSYATRGSRASNLAGYYWVTDSSMAWGLNVNDSLGVGAGQADYDIRFTGVTYAVTQGITEITDDYGAPFLTVTNGRGITNTVRDYVPSGTPPTGPGTLSSWGDNTWGQLGLGIIGGATVTTPEFVPEFPVAP